MSLHYTYSLTEGFREGVDGGEVKINGHVREKIRSPALRYPHHPHVRLSE